ncbi:MAG: polysaccharide export protein [Acidobacteriota bacterium]|nr:polysaccharide export protein [Acidobacteriota bacterium]MDH3785986.1 polysaccharide export protein [Acidobacteriota bacterium]
MRSSSFRFVLLLMTSWLCVVAMSIGMAMAEEPLVLQARPVTDAVQDSGTPLFNSGISDYRVGRQDLLEIEVFDVEELTQTVRVGEDGSISLPLLGRLAVAGLTKSELEDLIAGLLADRYVRNPQVTVFVKEYESKKIAVSGAVKKPGTFEMLGQKTLLEMISMAGGLDVDPGKQIFIFRREHGGETRRIAIELEQLVYQADPSLNVPLAPNDIVYVPNLQTVRIFVSGAVNTPNQYDVPRDEPVTVLKAITIAGGTTERAADKRVQVIRTDEAGNRSTMLINLRKVKRGKAEDPLLQKDDIVLVPEAYF